ncbi:MULTISPECIES: protoporphyrinogen oxidase HemJ [Rhodopseudomonas]|uniref:Protoporphyrinogen IX oxidase n=1 Tax=Rhodopseudomonas palustris TaxID=1076 RepID=A0A0D7E1Q6_RHOPL|nr:MULTISPECIES: protoporphyrinogen oxidase HemJ [Rhodopseudomonas]KIZ34400.1 membrane protein [Rhodopseudomonas palustris]MDF3808753.1 protoporphyrinogen oxidase HemJ [Rhodopseudomonas sp. BAL398]WOK16460.1 protoporphyrinogen oxidase HemJ [Rhodopseudomonas sp. BAL398]
MVELLYPWLKALHVIAVISWMAGMLYMPRLFVYHCDAEIGSKQSETFKIMERRLYKAIMTPAMVVAWIVGLYIAWDRNFLMEGWFHGKLTLVVLMTVIHFFLGHWVLAFAADRNQHSHKFYRIINEIPTVLMIGAVILVIVKPF